MSNPIKEVVEKLAPNTLVDAIYLNGLRVETTNFIALTHGVAYFKDNAILRVVNVKEINGLDFN